MRDFHALMILAIVPLISTCDRPDSTPSKQLPAPEGSTYYVGVETYNDGDYADQPFRLTVKAKNSNNVGSPILTAEQCKNVKLVQERHALYIFYESLALTSFSNFIDEGGVPKPFLCDLKFEFCQKELAAFQEAKQIVSDVCTYVRDENDRDDPNF